MHRLSDASSSSVTRAHAQLNLNAGGAIFPRYSPRSHTAAISGKVVIALLLLFPFRHGGGAAAPETLTATCTYPTRVCVCLRSRPLIFQNIIYLHITRGTSKSSWAFCKFIAPTARIVGK